MLLSDATARIDGARSFNTDLGNIFPAQQILISLPLSIYRRHEALLRISLYDYRRPTQVTGVEMG